MQVTFSDELESEISYLMEVSDEDGNGMTRIQAIKELIQNMDDHEHSAHEFKKELEDFGAKIGVFEAHSKEDLTRIMVSSGKKYDFKRGDTFYRFDSWEKLEQFGKGDYPCKPR